MKRVYFLSFWLLLTVGAATAQISLTTQINLKTFDKGVIINGVKWATRNVSKPGTFAPKPKDAGMFFQWNRRVGWSATDPMENSDDDTTWDDSDETGVIWRKSCDPSPVGWRLPTVEEIQKLLDDGKVKNEWTTVDGVNGRKFTDKTSGNSIFLPAAGHRTYSGGTLLNAGSDGFYWSSTAHEEYESDAYYLDFYNGGAAWRHSYGRGFGFRVGFSIRCVAE
jgi:uncharacterized protein (TIGR02145 family)